MLITASVGEVINSKSHLTVWDAEVELKLLQQFLGLQLLWLSGCNSVSVNSLVINSLHGISVGPRVGTPGKGKKKKKKSTAKKSYCTLKYQTVLRFLLI